MLSFGGKLVNLTGKGSTTSLTVGYFSKSVTPRDLSSQEGWVRVDQIYTGLFQSGESSANLRKLLLPEPHIKVILRV